MLAKNGIWQILNAQNVLAVTVCKNCLNLVRSFKKLLLTVDTNLELQNFACFKCYTFLNDSNNNGDNSHLNAYSVTYTY